MVTPSAPASAAILTPGRTCWRLDRADRFRCIQDGADYFRLVRHALLKARHSIFILGWDISGRVNLLPGEEPADAPVHLDELVRFIAKRNPRLRCYILIWDYGSLYTLERDPWSRYRLGWRTPKNVRFGFDDHHPFGASHHQKVIVVDDTLAFSGSLDLTGHRWDTSAHRVDDPDRITPTGKEYPPYHEVQAMLNGPAAASLGDLARERWRILGAKTLPPRRPLTESLWPEDVEPDVVSVDVAISRTVPGSPTTPRIGECEALFFDSIDVAKKTVFIENQYFTSERLGEALARRLAEADGPEVIVISPRECQGWLEKTTMGAFREAVFRKLRTADRYGRLRLVYPMASRARDIPTFIHSKVMAVDDELFRVGSANFSNRSLGMDTECDISLEALGDRRIQLGIRLMRDRLIGEHFGVDADTIARDHDRLGSLRAVIDAYAHRDRALLPIEPADDIEKPTEAVRDAADPAEPAGFGREIDRLLPALEVNEGRSHLRLWIVPAIVVLSAAIVGWSATHAGAPAFVDESRSWLARAGTNWSATWAAAGIFIVCAWLFVPVELLVLLSAVAFGPARGSAVSVIGSLGAAVSGYVAGRVLGPLVLMRWLGPRTYRVGRQLSAPGPTAVAAMRLATIATAMSVHLLCGAAKVKFRDYLVGSVAGIALPVAALGVLGGLLRSTLLEPTLWNALQTIGFAMLLAAATFAIRTLLLVRQFAPVTAGHRSRAEFG